jgi:hypothetical protein
LIKKWLPIDQSNLCWFPGASMPQGATSQGEISAKGASPMELTHDELEVLEEGTELAVEGLSGCCYASMTFTF